MAYKQKKNINFGEGTGSSPNKFMPLVNLAGFAWQQAKTYMGVKQGLKNLGVLEKDKTDLPMILGEIPIAGSEQYLFNEALHQYDKFKNKNKNKDKSEEKSNKEKTAITNQFKARSFSELFKNKEKKQEQKKSQKLTWAEAKKNDPNLSKYVAERKKYKKGSPEYNKLQNKINAAYTVKKRH